MRFSMAALGLVYQIIQTQYRLYKRRCKSLCRPVMVSSSNLCTLAELPSGMCSSFQTPVSASAESHETVLAGLSQQTTGDSSFFSQIIPVNIESMRSVNASSCFSKLRQSNYQSTPRWFD